MTFLVERRRKEFQKIKKKVLKRYPNATTQANSDGKILYHRWSWRCYR